MTPPRNTEELVRSLVDGARLTSGWKTRTMGMRARYEYRVTFADGTDCLVQKSMVDAALKRGTIRVSANWSGGYREYELGKVVVAHDRP